jgi:hypothetical protein
MLLTDIISDEVSMASNADAGIRFSSSIRPYGQRESAVPWKNHGLPLSARTSP